METAFWIILTFVLAGLVKGVSGMGLPTVALAILGAVMSPVAAASLMLVPSFVTNVWQLVTGPHLEVLWRRLWFMMAGIAVGTFLSSAWLVDDAITWTTPALGLTLVIYAGYSLLARPLCIPPRLEQLLSPAIGVLTGIVTGLTGVLVVPAVPYLQSLALARDDLVQALGLSFTVSTAALAMGLIWHGGFDAGRLGWSAAAVVPALLGMWIGQRLRTYISPPVFRRGFLVCMLLLGVELVVRGWWP
jgi:uncharacterized membrane protein YfcA